MFKKGGTSCYNINAICDDVTNSKLDDILPIKGLLLSA